MIKQKQIMSGEDPERKKEQSRIFLEGLKRYQRKGVSIFVDEEECREEELEKLLFVKEDGSFYMGDYIGEESGRVTEIHFDRVYYQ